jgi:hypothetical protein
VQVVIPFEDEADALRIANGTDYGLVAGVWTADGGRQMRMARGIETGQVFINNYGAGGGVELPFRRCEALRPWAGEGVRGAVRLCLAQDDCHPAWLKGDRSRIESAGEVSNATGS